MPATKRSRGKRVARARHLAGLSQQDIADEIGTPRSTVARVEIGMTTPTLDLALALSRALGRGVESLFGPEQHVTFMGAPPRCTVCLASVQLDALEWLRLGRGFDVWVCESCFPLSDAELRKRVRDGGVGGGDR
jgi:putative transcriptional regulator